MKAHIVQPLEAHIEGYTRVDVTDLVGGMSQFVDSECDQIFANDILDHISGKDIATAIKLIVSKMRLNSSLVIGGTDIRIFCKNVISGETAISAASDIIGKAKSMNTASDVVQALKMLGLTINSQTTNGAHYEIKATRNG